MIKTKEQKIASMSDSLLQLLRQNQKQKGKLPEQKNKYKSEQSESEQEASEEIEQSSESSQQMQQKMSKSKKVEDDISLNSEDERIAQEAFKNIERVQPAPKKKKNPIVFEIEDKSQQNKQDRHSQIHDKVKSILKNYEIDPELTKKKKKKRIRFDDEANKQYIIHNEGRRWDEKLPNAKKGKFDPHQKKLLIKSLGQCLSEKSMILEDIIKVLDEDGEKLPRDLHFWAKTCSVLADRPLISSYKFLKRELTSKNKSGPWSVSETAELISLVDKQGQKWSKISKQMNRTPQNVRDKYRAIINENSQEFKRQMWKLQEIADLLHLIEKKTHKKLLQSGFEKELEKADAHNQAQFRELQRKSYNSKKFVFHNNVVIKDYLTKNFNELKMSEIGWQKISEKMKDRTPFDCRNKILQILMINANNYGNRDQLQEKIVNFLLENKIQSEAEIEWNKWKAEDVSGEQARNRYMIFKRNIIGRGQKTFKELLEAMQGRINQKNNKK